MLVQGILAGEIGRSELKQGDRERVEAEIEGSNACVPGDGFRLLFEECRVREAGGANAHLK